MRNGLLVVCWIGAVTAGCASRQALPAEPRVEPEAPAAVAVEPEAPPPSLAEVCQEAVDGLDELHGEANVARDRAMQERTADVPELEVMRYFDVLDHLVMEEGYVLDYFLHEDGMGNAWPIVYARPESSLPATDTEAARALAEEGDNRSVFLRHVRADGTEAAFVQLAVLSVLAGQFHLDWHGAYFDSRVLCDSSKVEGVLASIDDRSTDGSDEGMPVSPIDPEQAAAARGLDAAPTVTSGDDGATVRLLSFTHFGGFVEHRLSFQPAAPHRILGQETETVVEYDCGFSY